MGLRPFGETIRAVRRTPGRFAFYRGRRAGPRQPTDRPAGLDHGAGAPGLRTAASVDGKGALVCGTHVLAQRRPEAARLPAVPEPARCDLGTCAGSKLGATGCSVADDAVHGRKVQAATGRAT